MLPFDDVIMPSLKYKYQTLVFCEVWQRIRTHAFCGLEVQATSLCNFWSVPGFGNGYAKRHKLQLESNPGNTFIVTSKMVVSHLKLSVTMVAGTSDQGKGAQVKQPRVSHLCHFCVSGVIIFFPKPCWIFFTITLKWALFVTIRYWNNGVCLSNQVNGNTRVRAKKAPGTRIRVDITRKWFWAAYLK